MIKLKGKNEIDWGGLTVPILLIIIGFIFMAISVSFLLSVGFGKNSAELILASVIGGLLFLAFGLFYVILEITEAKKRIGDEGK